MKTELFGILGPSKLNKNKLIRKNIEKVAKIISKKGIEIIISPDKKSTVEFFAKKYKEGGGKKIVGLDYKDEFAHSYPGLNRKICDKLINVKTWENQPKEIVKGSKHLIVLGISVGVIWELCLTKFYKPAKESKIFIIKELNKEKLSRIMNKTLAIKYISIDQLEKKLK